MDLKVNDASVKKLEVKTDAELARKFLVKKNLPKLTYEVISDEASKVSELQNSDNTVKYPYYCALQTIERAYFLTHVQDKYYSLVHDPKKYDLNFESIIALYNALLEENWAVFDRERVKAEKEAKEEGMVKRNFTTQFNADICNKVFTLIRNIDFSKTNSFGV